MKKLIVLFLLLLPLLSDFSITQVHAAPTREYLTERYPKLYSEEIWEFQELLQNLYGAECERQGLWLTYKTHLAKSYRCVSEQRWAVKTISRWYK